MASKQENLLNAISDAIPQIKESYPHATEDEISSAIIDYITSLISNPGEIIPKLTLPSKREFRVYSRKEYLKAQRSKFRSKRLEETNLKVELVNSLIDIRQYLDEEGNSQEASKFLDLITEFENDCIKKFSTIMKIDSALSGLINFGIKDKTDGEMERIWACFGDQNAK